MAPWPTNNTNVVLLGHSGTYFFSFHAITQIRKGFSRHHANQKDLSRITHTRQFYAISQIFVHFHAIRQQKRAIDAITHASLNRKDAQVLNYNHEPQVTLILEKHGNMTKNTRKNAHNYKFREKTKNRKKNREKPKKTKKTKILALAVNSR